MKYVVTIGTESREVEVRLDSSFAATVVLEGEERVLDVVRVPGGVCMRTGHTVRDVTLGEHGDARVVASLGVRAVVQIEDARTSRRKSFLPPTSAGELRSPMPGRIVKLLVRVGDSIGAGQPLVVMEAMKMENELRAESEGVVAAVEVKEGQSVEGNVLLVRVEPTRSDQRSIP